LAFLEISSFQLIMMRLSDTVDDDGPPVMDGVEGGSAKKVRGFTTEVLQ
jgi:hypothetical protein